MDEETLEYREYANTLVQAHDIAKFAKEQMGIELYPFQVEMVQHILSGNIMIGGRRFGKHTAVRVAKKYAKAQNG